MAVMILNKAPNPAKKKKVVGKVINDPKSIELEARRTLKNITKPIQEDLETIIDNMRDKSAREIGKELEAVKKNYDFQIQIVADQIADSWVAKVNRYNKKKFMADMRKTLGIDIGAIVDEAMKDDLEVMALESASYIKTIPSYLVGHVADRVIQHYKGLPMPENRTLKQQIKEEFKVSDGRARVLARDQTSKMNTSITAIRQQNIGIEWYIWRTVEDNAVVGAPGGLYPYNPKNKLHKNHYIMNNLLCKWDDPTVYSDDDGKTWKARTAEMPHNHPGDDIMCRCRPAPYINIEKLKVKWSE